MRKFDQDMYLYLRERMRTDKQLFDSYFETAFSDEGINENSFNMLAFMSNRMKESWSLILECELDEEEEE